MCHARQRLVSIRRESCSDVSVTKRLLSSHGPACVQRATPCCAPRDDHTRPTVPPLLYARPAFIGMLGQECTATFLLRFRRGPRDCGSSHSSGLHVYPIGHAGAHAPRDLRARGGPVKTAVADSVLDSSVHYALARKRVPSMDTIPHDHSGSDAPQEVANLGMVRPPLVYGVAIVTGLVLEFGWPLPCLPRLLAALLGSLTVLPH